MEVIVALVRLVYHDAASIGLELEIADAAKFYVSHHIGEHRLMKSALTQVYIAKLNNWYCKHNRLKTSARTTVSGAHRAPGAQAMPRHPNC